MVKIEAKRLGGKRLGGNVLGRNDLLLSLLNFGNSSAHIFNQSSVDKS